MKTCEIKKLAKNGKMTELRLRLKEIEKMELRTNKGIAGEFKFGGIDDVMSFVPFCRDWEAVAGSSRDAVHVMAVLTDDTKIRLEEAYESAHACSYDKTTVQDAPTVGEQISGLGAVKALIFQRDAYCSYQDGGDDDSQEILYLTPPDYKKIRRRLEDRLRKSGDDEIFRLAVLAGVNISHM